MLTIATLGSWSGRDGTKIRSRCTRPAGSPRTRQRALSVTEKSNRMTSRLARPIRGRWCGWNAPSWFRSLCVVSAIHTSPPAQQRKAIEIDRSSRRDRVRRCAGRPRRGQPDLCRRVRLRRRRVVCGPAAGSEVRGSSTSDAHLWIRTLMRRATGRLGSLGSASASIPLR